MLYSFLTILVLGSTTWAQIDLGNPITIAQYNQNQDMMNEKKAPKDYSSCIQEIAALGVDAQPGSKKLTFFTSSLPSLDKDQFYVITLEVCSADKSDCLTMDQKESEPFGADSIGQKIMSRDLVLGLGCTISYVKKYRSFAPSYVQVKFFERTPFYTTDNLIGKNYLPISKDLLQRRMIVPFTADRKSAVTVQVTDAPAK